MGLSRRRWVRPPLLAGTAQEVRKRRRRGQSGPGGPGVAGRPDTARPDTARPDTARPDTARPDTTRPDTTRSPGWSLGSRLPLPHGCTTLPDGKGASWTRPGPKPRPSSGKMGMLLVEPRRNQDTYVREQPLEMFSHCRSLAGQSNVSGMANRRL